MTTRKIGAFTNEVKDQCAGRTVDEILLMANDLHNEGKNIMDGCHGRPTKTTDIARLNHCIIHGHELRRFAFHMKQETK